MEVIKKLSLTDIQDLTFEFAVKAIELHDVMQERGEKIMSSGLLKTATHIGMIVNSIDENVQAKLLLNTAQQASKPTQACLYWLKLIERSEKASEDELADLKKNIAEIKESLMGKAKSAKSKTKIGFGNG